MKGGSLCKSLIASLLLVLGSSAASMQRLGPDALPRTIIDNEFVKVSEVSISEDHSSVATASKLPRILVFVSDFGSNGIGGSNLYEVENGDIEFLSANTTRKPKVPAGCDPLRAFMIELKSVPQVGNLKDDAVKLDPKHNKVLFENSLVRVVLIHFGLSESGPIVDKRPRVIILLTDTHAQVRTPNGQLSPRDSPAGSIQWSLGGRQATINGNIGPLENIVVELKGAEPKGK